MQWKMAFGVGALGWFLLCGGAAFAQRPWRLTLGYDSSQLAEGGGHSAQAASYTLYRTTSEQGALTVGVSFDFLRFPRYGLYGFIYGDLGGLLFTRLYSSGGVGARKEFGNVFGGNAYFGAGFGIYGLELGNGATLGGKAFLGLQSRGAGFIELGVPFPAASTFTSGVTIGVGLRL